MAFLNPVYTDEVIYFNLLTRFAADFPNKVFLFPQCTTGYLTQVPFTLWPAALICSSLSLVVQSFLSFRVFNLSCVLAIFFLFNRYLKVHSENDKKDFIFLSTTAFLGLLPFLLLIGRPENPSALVALALILIFLSNFRSNLVFVHLLSFLLFSLLVWLHPGNIIFLPIFLVALLANKSFSLRTKGLVVLVGGILAYQAISMHQASMTCPEDEFITGFFQNYARGLASNEESILVSIQNVLGDMLGRIFIVAPYLGSILPQTFYPLGILPNAPGNIPKSIVAILVVPTVVATTLAVYYLISSIVRTSVVAVRQRLLDFNLVLAISCLLGLIAFNVLFPFKAPYRTVTVYWLLSFSFVFLRASKIRIGLTMAAAPIYYGSLLTSILLSLLLYGGATWNSLFKLYPDGRAMSVGVLSERSRSEEVSFAFKECGFDKEEQESTLVVDFITFFYSQKFSRLVFINDTIRHPAMKGKHISDFGIDRVFVLCSELPEPIRNQYRQVGLVCCDKPLS